MKVNLGVGDRFALFSILPQEAHVLELKAMRPLRDALLPTAEEQQAMGMTINAAGQTQWVKGQEAPAMDFEINEILFDIIRKELKKLETAGKLPDKQLGLYETFVEKDFKKGK